MQRYGHVIVIGIDGAGAFIRDADTPCFDRIFAGGAVTYSALASNPTISAECWGSMLLGVGPEIHKLTNGVVSSTPYPTDSRFPSLFRRIRNAIPGAELGSFCDWNPITFGIVENDAGAATATARDDELMPLICSYIMEKKPTFLFTQLDSVDGAGHRYGYGSAEHLARIHEVDRLVNDAYRAAKDAGIIDDTLFIVIADHGGHPGLLEHHLGEQDAVRVRCAPPGQVPGVFPIPRQKGRRKGNWQVFSCQSFLFHDIIIPQAADSSHPSNMNFSKTS